MKETRDWHLCLCHVRGENGEMCNASNHSPGCDCGFGPPYQDLRVTITRLADPQDKSPSELGRLRLVFPIPKATSYNQLDDSSKTTVLKSILVPLQSIADKRFGEGHIRIQPIYLRKGSIELGVALVMACGVGVYAFFKDYEALRTGVLLFVRDLRSVSRYLRDQTKGTYAREVKRSRKDHRRGKRPVG